MAYRTKKNKRDLGYTDNDDEENADDADDEGSPYDDSTEVEITVAIGGIINVQLVAEYTLDLNDLEKAEKQLARVISTMRRAIPVVAMSAEESAYVRQNPHISMKKNGEMSFDSVETPTANKDKTDVDRA